MLKKSSYVKLNGCVKNSLVFSLQDITQDHLEVIELKQNKIDLKNLPFEIFNIL